MRQQRDMTIFILGLVAALAFIAGLLGLEYWECKMESNAYNRLTGAKTTAWDAWFLELRIQDQPKERK